MFIVKFYGLCGHCLLQVWLYEIVCTKSAIYVFYMSSCFGVCSTIKLTFTPRYGIVFWIIASCMTEVLVAVLYKLELNMIV